MKDVDNFLQVLKRFVFKQYKKSKYFTKKECRYFSTLLFCMHTLNFNEKINDVGI